MGSLPIRGFPCPSGSLELQVELSDDVDEVETPGPTERVGRYIVLNYISWDACDWYIYIHLVDFYSKLVGKV